MSFQGQDTFSTAYEALQVVTSDHESATDLIKKQPFVRIRATLATAATALSEDIPAYDPQAMIDSTQPIMAPDDTNTSIYGAEVEGEVSISTSALPASFVPKRRINDQAAQIYVRQTLENFFGEGGTGGGDAALAYAPDPTGVQDLGVVTDTGVAGGVAENVTVIPKSTTATEAGLGRTERILTVKEPTRIEDMLLKNGFTDKMIDAISSTLTNVYPSTTLPRGARLRILFGASRTSDVLIPYRLSIYMHDEASGADKHAATVALTDRGSYVLGLAPSEIAFPEEDTEEVNVSNLPTVYRSIWETARKHDIDDEITKRIVAMFAYDVDLTKKIAAGDSIEVLQTDAEGDGKQDLLYVALKLGSTERQLYRFRTSDGAVDFYDPEGETGKRFLTRRPLQGGGRLASRFGYRVHPIFKTRRLHSGVDLASPAGTPIYASGDGVVERAQWVSGYGRFVELKHVNGYETGYGHMSRIADGMKPGVKVRQGQIIGYVGSTGNSTGNHLHFEIKVNGRFVDPLSVKLPRDNSLPSQDSTAFKQTIAQINDLMKREAAPTRVAAIGGGATNG